MQNATGNDRKVERTVVVDLGLPPVERWVGIGQEYRQGIEVIWNYILAELPEPVRGHIDAFDRMFDRGERFLKEPYADEIVGLARGCGRSPGEILIANLYYEIKTACTGVIAVDQKRNITLHGRNLDYGIPGLQNVTVQIEFRENGSLLTKGTTYAGYVGLLTGASPIGVSLQLNERDTKTGSVWENAFEALFRGGAVGGFLIREVLVQKMDFSSALITLQNHPLIAPCYFIVGGPRGEGAVVTRERDSQVDTLTIDDARNPNKWFILQTNYDHWEQPPKDDDRRSYTAAHMRDLGKDNLTKDSLYEIMSQWPTQNAETTYTTIMTSTYTEGNGGNNDDESVYFTFTRNN